MLTETKSIILTQLAIYYHTTSSVDQDLPDEIIAKIEETSNQPTLDELIDDTYYYRIRRFFGFNKNRPNFPDWCRIEYNTEFFYVILTKDIYEKTKDTKFRFTRNTFWAHVMCMVTS